GPVLTRVYLAGAQPRHGLLDPCSPVRPPLGTRKRTLKASQTLVTPRAQPRCRQHLTRRQHRADRYPAVDADGLPVTWANDRRRDHGERDMPAPRAIKRDAVGLHLRRHRAGPAEPYPSGLRDAHLVHAAGQTAHVTGPDGDNPESLVPAGLPPRRTVMRAAQVVCQGLGEVAQRLLLHHLRACGQPQVLRAGGGELPTLLQVARSARAPRAPVSVLLDREVPNVPGVAAVFPQHRLLGGRGDQTVPGHTNTLANYTDISGKEKRRFLSDP